MGGRLLVGLAAGLIVGIGDVQLKVTDDFTIGGIALGTILVIVFYHLVSGRQGADTGHVSKAL